jgi:hypothetical protein
MEVSFSVTADQVGAAAATLRLRHDRVEIHVFAAERQQADDITVPLVAKGKTITGRLSAQAETTRRSGVPRRERRSLMRAESNGRSSERASRRLPKPDPGRRHCRLQPVLRGGPKTRAGNGRVLSGARPGQAPRPRHIAASARRGPGARPIAPLALEAVRRINRIFAIERKTRGRPVAERLAFRREGVAVVVANLDA